LRTARHRAADPDHRGRPPRVTRGDRKGDDGPGAHDPRPPRPVLLRPLGPRPTLDVERAIVVDAEDLERAAESEEHRAAQREVEDLVVGEYGPQAAEQLVVDRAMVGC